MYRLRPTLPTYCDTQCLAANWRRWKRERRKVSAEAETVRIAKNETKQEATCLT